MLRHKAVLKRARSQGCRGGMSREEPVRRAQTREGEGGTSMHMCVHMFVLWGCMWGTGQCPTHEGTSVNKHVGE